VEQAGKPVAKNLELLWNRPESLLPKNLELLWNRPESLLLKIWLTKKVIKIKLIRNDQNIVK